MFTLDELTYSLNHQLYLLVLQYVRIINFLHQYLKVTRYIVVPVRYIMFMTHILILYCLYLQNPGSIISHKPVCWKFNVHSSKTEQF